MRIILLSLSLLLQAQLQAQNGVTGFQMKHHVGKKQVDIFYNQKLLTSYCYYDSIMKPFLFPINTTDGITITRGYPLKPVAGDRTDHPHHTGLWLNYESVNGLDFWNNSTAIAPGKRINYGTIRHDKILLQKADKNKARLIVTANWQRPDKKTILTEATEYIFTVSGNRFYIDRKTSLTATDSTVVFKDVKDGFLGLRVARELEMPSKEPGVFIDAQGNETKVPVDNNGVTGNYINSNGVQGDSVWSSKSRWCMLTGRKNNERITIAMFDHPTNIGYPTYWHARGYGLFAANPLGRKIFSNGKEELNYKLQPGQSVTFHYMILIQAKEETDAAAMNAIADAFSKLN